MKIVRLLILNQAEVRQRLAGLGADVPETLTAGQLADLYCEYLEAMPPGVDVMGLYVGENLLNIVANDDAVWPLPERANSI
jgi:hypothetical protein